MKTKRPSLTTRERTKLVREAKLLIKGICRCGHYNSEHLCGPRDIDHFTKCTECACEQYEGNLPFTVTLR